ncbi:23S rRNA (cytidine1920-2'-O)/16S rRNA (cytidine1409-2'-O)-methyltransferase [Devosia lucknowensis]|uniref:23S rRNA (Cytidine1920-2'-O)/16S rRNA (Cytidine1409-2'-O)-methyltransferase n=1 Tax=Devosia lucknowensis TaxID=1096929 RepID=A0A1Y6E8A6_9HYPH|nr:TlyA family RNA methyltransferase [Devosia lucknowensis]SMQ58865.1 23S rRNA (cytidine1920-2'-O)/16S rRNA (cytidine1409-2'-O)-methyltransferase [Devosia lucknowensis]
MSRIRLDLALEQLGLMPSRARARDAILRGTVSVNGEPARKPNQMIGEDDVLVLDDPAAGYVSRAALKLIAGLEAGNVDVDGKVCLDVGSSTGGFTQVLLERGAAQVFAVDVGHDQLHASLRNEPRVISLEGTNARDLDRDLIPGAIDLVVSDVSFVSVTKVLSAPLALCSDRADAVILFKPQFEVGREFVGKGGIVTDAEANARAMDAAVAFVEGAGFTLRTKVVSPIAGGDGNVETVLVFRRGV